MRKITEFFLLTALHIGYAGHIPLRYITIEIVGSFEHCEEMERQENKQKIRNRVKISTVPVDLFEGRLDCNVL